MCLWGDCKVKGILGGSNFFWVIRNLEDLLGALGENLELAGVVLLLDRRDRRRFLFFCYTSRQSHVKVNDTYSEGGTHEETLHPQSKVKVMNKGQGDKVTIRRTVDL